MDGFLASRLQGAQAIDAMGQIECHRPPFAGAKGQVQFDVRRAHRSEQAIFAAVQGPDRPRRVKGEFHVFRIFLVEIDIARRAMGTLGQLVQRRHRCLAHLAARAKQVPPEPQQALPDRLQANLDGMAIRYVPQARQPERPDRTDVHLLAPQHVLGQLPRQAVAVGRGLDGGDQARHPVLGPRHEVRRLAVEFRRAPAIGEVAGVFGEPAEG